MQLAYAFLANYAEAVPGPNPRLNIIGADFNTVRVPAIPAFTQFAFVVKIGFESDEVGDRHKYRLQVCGPDQESTAIGGIEGEFGVEANRDRPEFGASTAFVIQVQAQLSSAGTYKLRLFVDDAEMATRPLYVYLSEPAHG